MQTKVLVDALIMRAPISVVGVSLASLMGAMLLGAIIPSWTLYFGNEVGRRAGVRAVGSLYDALANIKGISHFEDPHFLDRIRHAQQATATCDRLVMGLLGLVRDAISLVGILWALAVISLPMASSLLVTSVVVLLNQLRLARRRVAVIEHISPIQRREFFFSNLLVSVSAAKEIRLFNLSEFFKRQAIADRNRANAAKKSVERKESLTETFLSGLGILAIALGGIWAVWAVRDGSLSIGEMTAFIAAATGVQTAAGSIMNAVGGLHESLLLFGHFGELVHARSRLTSSHDDALLPQLREGLEVRDVWFKYEEGHPWVLRGVSFFIPRGQAVGIVGLNGAGKSTLIKLLCRFYEPQSGTILWDGIDISKMDVDALRSKISVVFQDHMNYDMSAAVNVALGDIARIGEAELIQRAAHQADIAHYLENLPNGYDTLLSRLFMGGPDENDAAVGVVPSGGQWQRIAISRAFFRGSRDLLLLDEPTSGLDPNGEADIRERLQGMRSRGVTILISHRLNTIRDADRILVVDEGVIAEDGTHDQLMNDAGVYSKLFSLQSDGYEISMGPAPID
ncbi:ABC transporter ATP-binding protein [Streptosporangium sp. KLBMP 9127]|nr:ABC transporter ATP-binding protein/permease [Streptosporangium sp. KLBMP 9127]